jgi:hypothetical protein
MNRIVLLGALATLAAAHAAPGLAQAPAAATGAAAAPVALPAPPKHACPAVEYPGKLASESALRNFRRGFDEYRACIRKFAEEQNALAKSYYEAGKVHADAANAAVKEHNEAVAKVMEAEKSK